MAWFDAFAKDYDSWYETKLGDFADRVQKNLIEQMAAPRPGEAALDIGAGTGNYSLWLARKGLQITAVDQSAEMMGLGKKKAEEEGLPIKWLLADAHALPFDENSFDMVTSITAIEFMDDPKDVLREAMRVLKPGGRLVIGLLTKESPWGALYQAMAEQDPTNLFAKAHLYTEQEIKELLPTYPYELKKGLYLPPAEDFDVQAASAMEAEKQQQQADQAGFFAVRWTKE